MYFSNEQFSFLEKEIMSIYDKIDSAKEFYKNNINSPNSNHLLMLGKITSCKDAMELIQELPKKIKTKNVLSVENVLMDKYLNLISNLKVINQSLNDKEIELLLKKAINDLEKVKKDLLKSGLSLPKESQ